MSKLTTFGLAISLQFSTAVEADLAVILPNGSNAFTVPVKNKEQAIEVGRGASNVSGRVITVTHLPPSTSGGKATSYLCQSGSKCVLTTPQ